MDELFFFARVIRVERERPVEQRDKRFDIRIVF
jgi:hypothetical protein